MGHTSYSVSDRDTKYRSIASTAGVDYMIGKSGSASLNMHDDKAFRAVFTQHVKGEMHELMNPKGLKFRECFDSETHPNTVPIIVGLDVTGSMGNVPKEFCMDGLPTMMSTIIQRGTPDAAVCFMAVGDHVYDHAPIQVGQFESGDAELDMWLTRTWLEGHGGGNDGESYALAWYVAARHTKLDSCSKRGVKGFLFTVGDEPSLQTLPASSLRAIFGSTDVQGSISDKEILKEAQACYHVYHIALKNRGETHWRDMLGQNYLPCDDYRKIPALIADIVSSFNPDSGNWKVIPPITTGPVVEPVEITL